MSELKLTVENGVQELVVLQGEAPKIHYPEQFQVGGVTISAIYEYLSKSNVSEPAILDSVLLFSYDRLTMKLQYRISDRNTHVLLTSIVLNPDLTQFEINSGKRYSPFGLSDFIKMNRHLFESKSVAMELVSVLRNIKASVNKAIEANKDERGNKRALIDQVVQTNIPESFNIELPVFKGQPKMIIPIEVVIDEDLECVLMSPDLKQIIAEQSELLIGAELDKIKELHPQLRIYQE